MWRRNLPAWARVLIAALAVWDLTWKGLALWQAGKRRQPVWFALLLVLNTAGVLPIVYLRLMKKRDAEEAAEPWAAAEAAAPWSAAGSAAPWTAPSDDLWSAQEPADA